MRRALLALAVLALAVGLAELPWCPRRHLGPPEVQRAVHGADALRAGAAREAFRIPYPVVVGGYGPPRPEARDALRPPGARALVLESGSVRLGLVALDVVIVPEALCADIRARARGLTDVWCSATHAHTSVGGYASGLLAQAAGVGRYRPAVHEALVAAAAHALEVAGQGPTPVHLLHGRADLRGWVESRNEVPLVDTRLDRLVLAGARGPVAELVLVAAHPTLGQRGAPHLDPDYPAALAEELDRALGGVTLVVQSAVGNASVHHEAVGSSPDAVASALAARVERTPVEPVPHPRLALARVAVPLPGPDARRLVPPWAAGPGANFLCAAAPRTAELGLLALGDVRLLAVPGEVTLEAAAPLEAAAGGARVLGLTNGYLGYVEAPARVTAAAGEARRQYFSPALDGVLAQGAAAARAALGLP